MRNHITNNSYFNTSKFQQLHFFICLVLMFQNLGKFLKNFEVYIILYFYFKSRKLMKIWMNFFFRKYIRIEINIDFVLFFLLQEFLHYF